jgi:hypothetical protein
VSSDPARAPGRTPPGSTPPAPPKRPRFRIGWWAAWIVGLLVLNFWIGSRATQAQQRVQIPYSPFFLQQVRAGYVS